MMTDQQVPFKQQRNQIVKRFISENKGLLIFYACILFAGLLYSTLGHWIIRIAYEPTIYRAGGLDKIKT